MSKVIVVLTVEDLRRALRRAEETDRSRVVFKLREPIEIKEETVYRVPVLSEDRT